MIPSVTGTPQTFRVKPLAGDPFVGVTANQPPGGSADVRCALGATVQADGSVAGAAVVGRGEFGARNLRVAMRRPPAGFFVARFAFSGTRLLRAGVDPNPMLLTVQRRRMGFVDPRGFPRCPGYRP